MNASKFKLFSRFIKELKRLERKYPQVLDEVDALIRQLELGERPGDKISGVGYDAYKVRLRNPSAKRGKSGGFRVIYFVCLGDEIFLLSIYFKNQQEDISIDEIRRAIESVLSDQS